MKKIIAEFEQQCSKGSEIDANMTFALYVNTIWLKDKSEQLKITTYTRYNQILKRIVPVIGHLKIE
ncbi:MAG: hypothetical protein LUI05_05865 [Oscillospiraceae bacterium]|nr:hypothetical protein [Oscillospiraceae bacterium]